MCVDDVPSDVRLSTDIIIIIEFVWMLFDQFPTDIWIATKTFIIPVILWIASDDVPGYARIDIYNSSLIVDLLE